MAASTSLINCRFNKASPNGNATQRTSNRIWGHYPRGRPFTVIRSRVAGECGIRRAWKPLHFDGGRKRRRSRLVSRLLNRRSGRPGNKLAPHHLFTLPDGSGGSVYVDPIAADGFPYKMFVHQRGDEVLKRAQSDAKHRWHEIAQAEGAKKYIVDDFTLVSRDGLHWEDTLRHASGRQMTGTPSLRFSDSTTVMPPDTR